MNRSKPERFGGSAAIAVGLLFVAAAAFELTSPSAENSTVAHAMNPTFFTWYHVTLSLLGILGLAAVPGITRLARRSEFTTWTGHLAMFGFAMLVADNFRQIRLDHQIAHEYLHADPAAQQAIVIAWRGLVELNPQALLTMLLLALWMVVISVGLPKAGRRFLLYLLGGFAVAIVLLVVGIAADLRIVRMAAVLVGTLAIPAWFVRLGIQARQGGAAV